VFAGLISKEQPVSAWGNPDKILIALAPYSLDKPRAVWAADRQLLVQVATRTGSTTAEIYRHPESGVAVAFWGRLDNRPDLIAQLEAEHKASDDELIALAWLKWGEHCPEQLVGDFAFAVASPKTGAVFLARDVMGVKPLFYRADEHGVFFANSAAAFKPLKLGTLTPSREWMARFVLEISYSHTETAYEEIKKLQGAHCLLIHADGRMNLRRYHQFVDDAPIERKRDPKYLEAYRAAWQEAVACRIPVMGNVGAENSGGLDSGSITAEIARQLGGNVDRLHAFGCCHGSLEPEFIMDTAMKWRIKHNILFSHEMGSYAFEVCDRMMRVNGYPLEYDENSYTYPTYQSCAIHSIGTLFSGHGGDQGVTQSNVQAIRNQLIDNRQWQALWRILPGSMPAKMARLVKNLVKAQYVQAPYREGWVETRKAHWRYQFLNHELVLKFNLDALNSAAASYDEGMRSVSQLAIKLLDTPYVSTRLENSSLEAASFSIDYVWPMLDTRLVQQWLSTPAIWKIGDGGLPRYLHRRAIAGVSTERVTWSPDKSPGVYAYEAQYGPMDFRPGLKQLLEDLHARQSHVLMLLDVDKAKRITDSDSDSLWDYIGEETVNKLKILDLWL
jgi:asparagine synthase (glutamine-hydrolysing)